MDTTKERMKASLKLETVPEVGPRKKKKKKYEDSIDLGATPDLVVQGRTKRKYTQTVLEEALRSVKEGNMGLRAASRHYGVPLTTLTDKHAGKVAILCKKGPPTILSKSEEDAIENWLINMDQLGFPVNWDNLKYTVMKILKNSGRNNPFPHDVPGISWYKSYLIRHPAVRDMVREQTKRKRLAASEEGLKVWFNKLRNHLETNNCGDILVEPSRMFILDESAFLFYKATGNYIGVWKQSQPVGKEREQLTVTSFFSANGNSVPPLLVYPYKKIPPLLSKVFPSSWFMASSGTGCSAFMEYIKTLQTWLICEEIQLPVFMLIDAQRNHIDMEVSDFCKEVGILLFCLYPNGKRLPQPIYFGIYDQLKKHWTKALQSNIADNGTPVTKKNFASLLKPVWETIVTPSGIRSAFRKARLYPFNSDAVDNIDTIDNHGDDWENILQAGKVEDTVNESILYHLTDGSQDQEIVEGRDINSLLREALENYLGTEVTDAYKDIQDTHGVLQSPKKTLFGFWQSLNNREFDPR